MTRQSSSVENTALLPAKPATRTSYFLTMVGTIVGSVVLLACTPLWFSYLNITGDQAAVITQVIIEKCLQAIIATVSIFGGTRGFVTLIKTFGPMVTERVMEYMLEIQREKFQAASIPLAPVTGTAPETIEDFVPRYAEYSAENEADDALAPPSEPVLSEADHNAIAKRVIAGLRERE